MPKTHTFHKSERLCSVIAIERLFNRESQSFSAFPIRVVYRLEEKGENEPSDVKVLISVSKKHFHNAVDRNRVKRQIREAYRVRKSVLHQALANQHTTLLLAFIWQDGKHWESNDVNSRVEKLLNRLAEKISHERSVPNAE